MTLWTKVDTSSQEPSQKCPETPTFQPSSSPNLPNSPVNTTSTTSTPLGTQISTSTKTSPHPQPTVAKTTASLAISSGIFTSSSPKVSTNLPPNSETSIRSSQSTQSAAVFASPLSHQKLTSQVTDSTSSLPAHTHPDSMQNNPPKVGFPSLLTTFRAVKLDHLMAGISGGVISTLLLHPLDLLKIRFAVDDGSQSKHQYNGVRDAFSRILRSEGIAGLFRGVVPNTVGAGSAWGLYFLSYQTIKGNMQGGNSKVQLTPKDHLLAASEAGIISLGFTNPLWVVKTRLCLQCALQDQAPGKDATRYYSGMYDAFKKIIKYEGVKGLYKGFTPGLIGVSHGSVQFMVYEELKTKFNRYRGQPIDTKLESAEYLFFAAVSKLVAALTTYPYQVIRARLQDANCQYKGTWDCVKKTVRYEGVAGMYKGMTPYLVHVMPNICLVFLIYENMINVSSNNDD